MKWLLLVWLATGEPALELVSPDLCAAVVIEIDAGRTVSVETTDGRTIEVVEASCVAPPDARAEALK